MSNIGNAFVAHTKPRKQAGWKGICEKCEKPKHVTKGGMIYRHGDCAGSGQKPLRAAAWEDLGWTPIGSIDEDSNE